MEDGKETIENYFLQKKNLDIILTPGQNNIQKVFSVRFLQDFLSPE